MRRTKQNHGIFADMICPKMQNFLFILQIMFLLHKSNIISFPNGLATVVGKRIQLHTHSVVRYPNVHSSFFFIKLYASESASHFIVLISLNCL